FERDRFDSRLSGRGRGLRTRRQQPGLARGRPGKTACFGKTFPLRMRMVVIGLGVQGRKRRALAGKEFIAAIDPVHPEAEFKTIQEVPVEAFDAAFVCVPDSEKLPILRYLLAEGKHWLVEKPLLAHPEELRELRETAQPKKLACYTAYNHR